MRFPEAGCNEAELIRRIQTGDAEDSASAFEEMVNLHGNTLLKFLSSRGFTSDEQKDAFSETWERAYRKIGQYQDRGVSIVAWLKAIAGRVVLEHFKIQRRFPGDPFDVDKVDAEVWDCNTPEDEVFRTFTQHQIQAAIHTLLTDAPEDYRRYIEARFSLDFSVEEIQVLYDWPSDKVYITKSRALQWLKKNLLKHYKIDEIQMWLS